MVRLVPSRLSTTRPGAARTGARTAALIACLALALTLGAAPASALQSTAPAPDLVFGVVESLSARVVPETGIILTNVVVRSTDPERSSGTDAFTMRGGAVGEIGMWSEQYTELKIGDFVSAEVVRENGVANAAAAPKVQVAPGEEFVLGSGRIDAATAAGYLYDGYHWEDISLPIPYYVNQSGLPGGSVGAIQGAAQTWEDDPGSYIAYEYKGSTSTTSAVYDGVNVVSAGSIAKSSTIAECTIWFMMFTKRILQFDIIYNTAFHEFATDGMSLSAYDVRTIGTHEFGHTLHLKDLYEAEDSDQVMYGFGDPGPFGRRDLNWGDIAGVGAIYPAETVTTGSLSGTVYDTGDNLLEDVTVTLDGYPGVTTDEEGSYSVEGVAPGSYDVTFEKPGYDTQTDYVAIDAGESTILDMIMSPSDETFYTLTYLDGPGGDITGDLSQSVISGGQGTTVEAVADDGFHFVHWEEDGNTNAVRTDANVTRDLSFTAEFASDVQTHTLTYVAGAGGHIDGDLSQIVWDGAGGTTVEAVADDGFHFVHWEEDGSTHPERTDTNVTSDLSFNAEFAPNVQTHTLNYGAGSGGYIWGALSQTVNEGASGSPVTAVPYGGYHFVIWSDGFAQPTRVESNVSAPVAVTAVFARDLKATAVSLKASPTKVKKGRTVRLSGSVSKSLGKRTHVAIWALRPGAAAWVYVKTVHTTSAHKWSTSYKPKVKGSWYFQARYAGNATYARSASGSRRVRVR